jgi:hypothetical protein
MVKGGIKHQAPMQLRELPPPRYHIMLDFMGPIYGIYYILVIIDYFTGYTDVALETILYRWVPYFGWFKIIETDLGGAFTSQLCKRIFRALDIKQAFGEPRNHKGTCKVERIIGILQQVLNLYNVQAGGQLVKYKDAEIAWDKICGLLPFIQFSINQRKLRFTSQSPNMLMFGYQLYDIPDLSDLIINLKKELNDKKIKSNDYEYLDEIKTHFEYLHKIYKSDWEKYSLITKRYYDKKYNISEEKIEVLNKRFKIGSKVVYYIGDKEVELRKWRQRWTGPWNIIDRPDTRTAIITGNKGGQFRASIDRLKLYNNELYEKFNENFKELELKNKDIKLLKK